MTFSLFTRMYYFGVVRLISLPMNLTPVFYTISTAFPHFHHDTSFDTRFTFHDSRHTFQIVTIDFNRSKLTDAINQYKSKMAAYQFQQKNAGADDRQFSSNIVRIHDCAENQRASHSDRLL